MQTADDGNWKVLLPFRRAEKWDKWELDVRGRGKWSMMSFGKSINQCSSIP